MAQYSVRLDTVQLISTANPYPYWDQLIIAMSVDRIRTVNNARKVVGSAGWRTAYLGGMGRGAMKELISVKPEGGTEWEIDVPEPEPGEELRLSIGIRNVRGLSDQEITRLMGKIGVFSSEAIVGEFIETVGTAASIAKSVGLGIAGLILEHVIDELFPDPPSCTGRVMEATMSCNPVTLAGRFPHLHTSELQNWLGEEVEEAPGEDCGRPCARVLCTVKRRFFLSFGPVTSIKNIYAELDTLRIDDIVGTWVDEGSSASASQRVKVTISKGNIELKDSVNVIVQEKHFGQGNVVTNVVTRQYADLHLEWLGRLLPNKEVFGDLQPLSLLPSTPRLPVLVTNLDGIGLNEETGESQEPKQPGLAAASSTTLLESPKVSDFHSVSVEFHNILLLSELQYRGIDDPPTIGLMLRRTACLPLPNGIILSVWAVFTMINGKAEPTSDIAIRYSRSDNLVATRTDCWLARWKLIK